ncbi:hypothetical protein ACHAW6_014699 [Cyclotella cf. meneghiniana]
MENFMKGINPSLPLSVNTRKQENCQDFEADARVPISEQPMVTTGTKHAIHCGDFTDALKEWTCLSNVDKTWPNCKMHWTRAFQENRDIQRLTGGTFMTQANSIIDNELSNKMVICLNNLANASIQKMTPSKNWSTPTNNLPTQSTNCRSKTKKFVSCWKHILALQQRR